MDGSFILYKHLLALCSSCTSIQVEKRTQVPNELVSMADEVLSDFFATDPAVEAAFHKSVGYFVGDTSMGMVALVGAAGSIGVLYDKQKNERTFLNINTLDLGIGVAGADFKLLVLFKTAVALEKVKEGLWTVGPTAASMAGKYGSIASVEREGWTAYVLSKSGAALGGALTLSRVKNNMVCDPINHNIRKL